MLVFGFSLLIIIESDSTIDLTFYFRVLMLFLLVTIGINVFINVGRIFFTDFLFFRFSSFCSREWSSLISGGLVFVILLQPQPQLTGIPATRRIFFYFPNKNSNFLFAVLVLNSFIHCTWPRKLA
jgi:hypothetical protein